jgi:NitT/TauT family transport system ATP-binding protein
MIAMKNISKTFEENSLHALRDVSFEINKGEFVAVVGPSGCGKTTLLKIIAGLLEPSNGTIEFSKENPSIGFVFQKPNLLDWRSVQENVQLPLELNDRKKSVKKILELVEMEKFRDFLPNQLSGGMQQRVAIARALAINPDVLLMDEPFSSLDDFSREDLNIVLNNIWEKTKKTVVFVTHNLEEAIFLADKIIVLGERPANVKAVLPVSIPRPRKPEVKHTAEFQGYKRWIKATLSA